MTVAAVAANDAVADGAPTTQPPRPALPAILALTPVDVGSAASPPDTPAGPSDDALHRARRHSALVLERLRALREGQARADLPEHLQLNCHRGHNGHYDIYGRMWWDRPAPTLTSGCTNVTRGRFAHPEQDRAITVREAMLLQTFPPSTTLRGGIEAMSLQVGNAIPPRLAEHIGRTVLHMEEAALEAAAAA